MQVVGVPKASGKFSRLISVERRYSASFRDNNVPIDDLGLSKANEWRRAYRVGNRDKAREYDKDYRRRAGDNRKDYFIRYRLQNERSLKEYKKQYGLLNRDKKKDYYRSYHLQNQGRKREYFQKYCRQNEDKVKDYRVEKCASSSLKSWRTPELVRSYLVSVAQELRISSYDDWYRISRPQLALIGGRTLFEKFGNLGGALRFAYPEINWDMGRFSFTGKKKSVQRWMRLRLEEMLPGIEVVEDYQHPELTWQRLGRNVELDIWIPLYRIGLEYQGEQHYNNLDGAFGPGGASSLYSERDKMKQSLCAVYGITLIQIPYWWDGGKETLSAIIARTHPALLPEKVVTANIE